MKEIPNYSEYRVFVKSPAPFSNREDLFCVHHELQEKKAYITQDDIPKKSKIPREKGFVRVHRGSKFIYFSNTVVGGMVLEEVKDYTKVTYVLNVHAGVRK